MKPIDYPRIIFRTSNAIEAKEVFDHILSKGVNPTVEMYNELISKQSDLNSALEIYDEILASRATPNKETFYYLIDFQMSTKGQIGRSVKLDDRNTKVLEASCKTFAKAARNNPREFYLWGYWGIALSRRARPDNQKMFIKALKKYETAIAINPDSHQVFYNWGNALCDVAEIRGKDEAVLEKGFSKYQLAVEKKPDFSEAYDNWGSSLLMLANSKNDLTIYREAFKKLSMAYEYGAGPYNLACYYVLTDQKTKAFEFLEDSLRQKSISVEHVEKDPDWAQYTDDIEFKMLLEKYRTHLQKGL